jgi:hypothetical protein
MPAPASVMVPVVAPCVGISAPKSSQRPLAS